MASFPSSVKTFSTIVDLVDSVLAAHQNQRGDEITAIETYLRGDTNVTVTTSNVTAAENKIYNLTIAGLTANRNFIVPVASAAGQYLTMNIIDGDATYNMIVIGDATVTINGGTAATEWDRTQTIGESVTLRSTSTTNWQVIASTFAPAAVASSGIGANIALNSNFNNWEQGTSFTAATTPANSDDTYLADQWVLLSDGNDIVDVSQQTSSPPAGSRYFHRADVQTANKKFGFIQFIEAADAIPLRGKNVSLSIHAKTTAAAISNIRAAVLSWDGTADAVTSDVVSAWNASGSNITPVANWTLENTPANLALTTSWQTFTIENIALDTSGLNNIAIFIWVDDTNASVNDILDLGWVKLEVGSTATTFIPPDYITDRNKCKRFFYRWGYENSDSGTGGRVFGNGGAGVFEGLTFLHPVEMRTIPTGTKAGTWGVTNCGQPAIADISTKSFGIFTQVTAGGSFDFFTNGADDYVQFDARL